MRHWFGCWHPWAWHGYRMPYGYPYGGYGYGYPWGAMLEEQERWLTSELDEVRNA